MSRLKFALPPLVATTSPFSWVSAQMLLGPTAPVRLTGRILDEPVATQKLVEAVVEITPPSTLQLAADV